ncbi:MAG: hypothetical protein E4H16_00055 [Candidatus Atribacteria bacterium]|nr:MAG: hypothetical protein E4H16_00055 [Candidatus Atribacteria bacterium]
MWNPRKLGIEGETLGHVHFAIDYLRSPEVNCLGDRLCIIGAGNVAMDVARTALRNGVREVTVLSRLGKEDITVRQHEVDLLGLMV